MHIQVDLNLPCCSPKLKGLWRNGSASDSRSEGWELDSLWPHWVLALTGMSAALMLLVRKQSNFLVVVFMCLTHTMTVWPSGLRRWLKVPFRKGVGSNPTAVSGWWWSRGTMDREGGVEEKKKKKKKKKHKCFFEARKKWKWDFYFSLAAQKNERQHAMNMLFWQK